MFQGHLRYCVIGYGGTVMFQGQPEMSPHQDCLSNGSIRDVAVQHRQLGKQGEAVQVSSSPPSPLRLWNRNPA